MGLDWITVLTKKGTDTEVGIGAGDYKGYTHLRAKSLCWILKEIDHSFADRDEFYGEGDEQQFVAKDFLNELADVIDQLAQSMLRVIFSGPGDEELQEEKTEILGDAEEYLHDVLEYMNNEDSQYDIHVRACY